MNPIKAIRQNCIECMGGSREDVKSCTITACALHPFRLGKNPFRSKRVMTDEQRAAASERLAKARSTKKEA